MTFALTGGALPVELPNTWWQWLLMLIGLLVTGLLVKLNVTFDANVFLKERDKRRIHRLQNACTHISIEQMGEGNLRVTNCFQSPPGTTLYFCRRCQVSSYDPEVDYSGRIEYYVSNPVEYQKAEARFRKLLKRAGYVA